MQLGWARGARSSLPAAQGGKRLWDRLPRDLLPPDPLLLLAQRLQGDAGSALPRFNNPSPVPGRIKRTSGFVQPVELSAAGAGPAARGRVPGAQIIAAKSTPPPGSEMLWTGHCSNEGDQAGRQLLRPPQSPDLGFNHLPATYTGTSGSFIFPQHGAGAAGAA